MQTTWQESDLRRTKYKDAVAELKKSLCPAAQCETFYALFESRALRTGEMGVRKSPRQG